MDALSEAVRVALFEAEQARRIRARETLRHILVTTVLSLAIFGVAALLVVL